MQVTETRAEGLSREYKIVVPAEHIEKRIQDKLLEIGKTAKIPGFRSGKIPMELLRQRYANSVMGEILESTIHASSEQAVRDQKLQLAGRPHIQIDTFEAGQDLKYTMSLDLLPELPKIDLGSVEVERLYAEVDSERLNAALNDIAERHRGPKTEPKGAPAAMGDQVVFDFIGRVDGEPFDGGTANDFPLILGSGRFIPGFEDQLVGAGSGDHRVVKVTFPADYHAPHIAGKDAEFECTVKEVFEMEPPHLDDALAQSLGLETFAALEKAVKEELARDLEGVAKRRLHSTAMTALMAACDFELPPRMVADEFEILWQRHKQAAGHGHHDHDHVHGPDCDHSHDEPEDEETKAMRAQCHDVAERQVRGAILLSSIGRQNGIEVSSVDMDKALKEEAASYPGREQQVINYYRNNPQLMSSLHARAMEEKVMSYVCGRIKIQDRKVSFEDLIAFPSVESEDKEAKGKKTAKSKKK